MRPSSTTVWCRKPLTGDDRSDWPQTSTDRRLQCQIRTTKCPEIRQFLGHFEVRELVGQFALKAWWARQDSNLQPDRYERSALTS